jgi:hypothetical protein
MEETMKWEWNGKEDRLDKSGVLEFVFAAGKISIELPDFSQAHYLAQLIHKEIQAAERRGATNAVARYARLGNKITNDA